MNQRLSSTIPQIILLAGIAFFAQLFAHSVVCWEEYNPTTHLIEVVAISIILGIVTLQIRAVFERLEQRHQQTGYALRDSQEKLKIAIEAAGLGIWEWDVSTGIMQGSAQCSALFGLEPGQFPRTYSEFLEMVYPADRILVEQSQLNAKRQKTPWKLDYRIVHPDGSIHWMSASGKYLYDAAGQATRMLGVVGDISQQKQTHTTLKQLNEMLEARVQARTTELSEVNQHLERELSERKQAELALRASEERWQLAIQGTNDGIWDQDLTTNLQFLSPRCLEMIGYDYAEVKSFELWGTYIHPEDFPRFQSRFRQHLERKTDYYICEYRFRCKDGSYKWLLARGQAHWNEQGVPIRMVGSLSDITDRKQAEDELCSLAYRLKQSNQELENFAFIASHDLKEPLRTIRNFSGLLANRYQPQLDTQGQDYIQRIQRACLRMQAQIDDLLALSRVTTQAQPFVLVNLNQVVPSVLLALEAKIQETQAEIEVEPLPTIEADPGQIYQLLQNLISNALKFHGSDPPHIKIYSSLQSTVPVHSNPTDSQIGLLCQILVEDQGIGFDEQYVDRIFEPFERLHCHRDYPGTGIGLAICRKIAERHGGSVTAKSRPGRGATFIISLPVYHPV